MTQATLFFLGTGGSQGIPMIGCSCPVCQSKHAYNHRLRCSSFIKIGRKQFLIDIGPDFREQILRAGIKRLDGVLITHTHYDHTGGLDDLRSFNFIQQEAIPCLLSKTSFEDLQKRFYYLFNPRQMDQTLTAQIEFEVLEMLEGNCNFQGIPVEYFSYTQGGMPVLGFRFGDLAYVTDIHDYSESIFEKLQGISTLVISALRYRPSFLHLSVEEAIIFSRKAGAKKTYFTHISHELEHAQLQDSLPDGIVAAYDGLEIPFLV